MEATRDVLDNPIWESLHGPHRSIAMSATTALRYPADYGPFVGVSNADGEADARLLVEPGEHVFFLGIAPAFTDEWEIDVAVEILQMVWSPSIDLGEQEISDEVTRLDAKDHADMLALTALVYPTYFRPRTPELGIYFGIRHAGQLVSMAGTRMAPPGYREISAVCTHPAFRSRGYARQLISRLLVYIRNEGNTPFLHTEAENLAAQKLYGSLGFRARRLIPLWGASRRVHG